MTLDDFRLEWNNSESCITAHTSGSTGAPKAVRLPKADMLVSARATNRFFGLDNCSDFVCPLAVDYIAGKMMAVRAWIVGTEPVFVRASNTPELSGHASLLAIVPSQVPYILQLINDKVLQVDNLLIGGANLSETSKQKIVRAGIVAYESYGMTETCSHVALRRVGDSSFRAMPGVSFDVDKRGCLTITYPEMSFGCLQTNDIVTLFSPTEFIWRGRYDNVINSGGIKIFPEELEAEIVRTINPDFSFYITSAPSEKWGNETVLVAECTKNQLQCLRKSLDAVLDHHKLPKQYYAVCALPRTANGKIRRILPY